MTAVMTATESTIKLEWLELRCELRTDGGEKLSVSLLDMGCAGLSPNIIIIEDDRVKIRVEEMQVWVPCEPTERIFS
jgi:hypothetical protein